MKKTLFVFSGEGTSNRESTYRLISSSPLWGECRDILKSRFDVDLALIWDRHIGSHAGVYSPLLTLVNGICLSDLWMKWGYTPDVAIGHSTGEMAAAYRAGFYSLETVLSLALSIGQAASKRDGAMMHGFVTPDEVEAFPVYVSSKNFTDDGLVHVTVSGPEDEITAFAQTRPGFRPMKPPHPWHNPGYSVHTESLTQWPCRKGSDTKFVSGITGGFETQLADDYWAQWMIHPVDFIRAMDSICCRYPDLEWEIIEIGFHPVLDQSCTVFPSYTWVSSQFRGEDDIPWILSQRRKLDPAPFRQALTLALDGFEPALDFDTSLAYQGLTSLRFVELSTRLQQLFPSLAPQAFYRHKTLNQLIGEFGTQPVETARQARVAGKNQVVICGMSCRFPSQAETPAQFWEALTSRADQVDASPERGHTVAGFLKGDNARFDHSYFKISPAEAATMDPQQILALELTEMLWRDAGLDPEALDRKRIGVYLGVWNQEYPGDSGSVFYPTGTNPSIIASRISYHYDLRGPSFVVNTACSSSLLAMHYAARDIEDGRVDYAIAGGVNMILGDGFSDIMGHAGFLSKDSRCKTFDNDANGYVRSEGGGLVLLAAKQRVHRYYADMLGSAVNQNGGRSQVITAPHPEAQEELILDACQDAGIEPSGLAYVECHGTGTKIGDPIEITAIQNTVARNRSEPCYLGSVKSNLGHLESAAGIAGVIKSVLALNQGRIPPNLHFKTPNRFIDFESHELKVVAEETGLDKEALVGVSSFGFGGANAHIILKGAEDRFRKDMQVVGIPFDKQRAASVVDYIGVEESLDVEKVAEPVDSGETGVTSAGREPVAQTIREMFFDLTGINEIDPGVELTEQGLNSLSFTEMISQLELIYDISIEPDVMFDYPFFDQLVDHVLTLTVGGQPEDGGKAESGRDPVADTIKGLFFDLTGINEVDPEVELTEQGLNSLSFTELISQLEVIYDISIEPDVMFDYPFFDQLVDHVLTLVEDN